MPRTQIQTYIRVGNVPELIRVTITIDTDGLPSAFVNPLIAGCESVPALVASAVPGFIVLHTRTITPPLAVMNEPLTDNPEPEEDR